MGIRKTCAQRGCTNTGPREAVELLFLDILEGLHCFKDKQMDVCLDSRLFVTYLEEERLYGKQVIYFHLFF